VLDIVFLKQPFVLTHKGGKRINLFAAENWEIINMASNDNPKLNSVQE